MLRVVVDLAREHRPEDASVLVGQRHQRFLPAHALAQLDQPLRDAVTSLGRGQQRRLGALDQQGAQEQGAQVVVAAFGDASQPMLAAAGVLTGHQAQPGAELARTLELTHVADCGHQGRGGELASTVRSVRSTAWTW